MKFNTALTVVTLLSLAGSCSAVKFTSGDSVPRKSLKAVARTLHERRTKDLKSFQYDSYPLKRYVFSDYEKELLNTMDPNDVSEATILKVLRSARDAEANMAAATVEKASEADNVASVEEIPKSDPTLLEGKASGIADTNEPESKEGVNIIEAGRSDHTSTLADSIRTPQDIPKQTRVKRNRLLDTALAASGFNPKVGRKPKQVNSSDQKQSASINISDNLPPGIENYDISAAPISTESLNRQTQEPSVIIEDPLASTLGGQGAHQLPPTDLNADSIIDPPADENEETKTSEENKKNENAEEPLKQEHVQSSSPEIILNTNQEKSAESIDSANASSNAGTTIISSLDIDPAIQSSNDLISGATTNSNPQHLQQDLQEDFDSFSYVEPLKKGGSEYIDPTPIEEHKTTEPENKGNGTETTVKSGEPTGPKPLEVTGEKNKAPELTEPENKGKLNGTTLNVDPKRPTEPEINGKRSETENVDPETLTNQKSHWERYKILYFGAIALSVTSIAAYFLVNKFENDETDL